MSRNRWKIRSFGSFLWVLSLLVVLPCAAQDPAAAAAAKNDALNKSLREATGWAESARLVPEGDNLVVSVDFVSARLNDGGKQSLLRKSQVPLLEAQLLTASLETAAKRADGVDSLEEVQKIWKEERDVFIAKLDSECAETPKVILLWTKFLDTWESEAVKVAPTRFRVALLQLGPIVTGILLEHEKAHIEAAMKKGIVTKGASSGGSGAGSDSSGHHHHSAHMPLMRWQVKRVKGMRQLRSELQ